MLGTILRQNASPKNPISSWEPSMSKILQVLSSNKIEALNQVMDTCDSYFNSLLQSENKAQG